MIRKAKFHPLKIDNLLMETNKLPKYGILKLSDDGLLYLDIDNRYIKKLFPILNQKILHVMEPNYFSDKGVGAHITVIYPEEFEKIDVEDLNLKHHFEIAGAYWADFIEKRYYLLRVRSPSLSAVRKKYGLPKLLDFRNFWVDFHITLGKFSR